MIRPKAVLWAIALVLVLSGCATTSKAPPSSDSTQVPVVKAAPLLRVGGYYASNNIYKRNYQVADLPAAKLTHVYYAFTKIGDDFSVTFYDKNGDVDKKFGNEPPGLGYRGNFAQFQLLKQSYPKLRTILSVGGGNMSDKFSPMVATAKTRQVFIDSAVVFIKKYGLDGIDIDWEFPVEGGHADNPHSPQDGKNLTLLMQGLRKAFTAAAASDGRSYEVGLTVSPNPGYGKYLETKALGSIVDFFNLMTYDYHGAWDKMSFHLAPLYANPADPGYKWAAGRKLNVAGAVQYYLDAGMPAAKINVGIPLYGIAWQVAPKLKNPLFAPTVEKVTSKDVGVVDYAEVQQMIAKGIPTDWDEDSRAAYLYDKNTGLFVSYDDGKSVTEKVELVVEKNLGGVFFWELSQDRGADLVNFTTWALKRAQAK